MVEQLNLRQTSATRFLSTLHWGALASHLKPTLCGPTVFWGDLCPCHLDTKAGAIVSTTQRCPCVYCFVATLMKWWRLVWARHLGVTVGGLICPPDAVPVWVFKMEEDRESSQFLIPFKLWLSFCTLVQLRLVWACRP